VAETKKGMPAVKAAVAARKLRRLGCGGVEFTGASPKQVAITEKLTLNDTTSASHSHSGRESGYFKQPFRHTTGANVARIETKVTPKRINKSGHHLSNQDCVSLDELISTSSFFTCRS